MSSDMKVELVQIIFRHGARTCIKSVEAVHMPNHIDQALHEHYGYEQLTNYGKAQMYKLGRALRRRYDDFLGPNYHPNDVCARSTDFDRSKMSLQLVLAGLYPPSAEQTFHQHLNWMPVPFSAVPKELDFLLLMFEKQRYRSLMQESRKSSASNEESESERKIRLFFEDKDVPAFKSQARSAAFACYNVLNTHKRASCALPDWYSEEIFEALREGVIKYLDAMSGSLELKKTLSGPLLKRVVENMNVNERVSNPRKIYLFSGHEFNVAGFLRAHEIEQMKYPDFGSAVVVEKLRDSEGQLFVRMLAWTGKDDDGDFFALKFAEHGEVCPIRAYLSIVGPVLPSDEELDAMYRECKVDLKAVNSSDAAFEANFVP